MSAAAYRIRIIYGWLCWRIVVKLWPSGSLPPGHFLAWAGFYAYADGGYAGYLARLHAKRAEQ